VGCELVMSARFFAMPVAIPLPSHFSDFPVAYFAFSVGEFLWSVAPPF